MTKPIALIVGVGDGLSASLARLFHSEGYKLVLAARNIDKIKELANTTDATTAQCDASSEDDVKKLFSGIEGTLRVVIYNPSARLRGSIVELDPSAVSNAIQITAFGAFLVGQAAAEKMLSQEADNGVLGTVLFTGASAGVKGFPKSAPFAMGKFAQRGLAQSMARELHPRGIHVAWVNIDGGIRNPGRTEPPENPDSMLDPEAIAREYLRIVQQDRSAWSNEIELRPWVENF